MKVNVMEKVSNIGTMAHTTMETGNLTYPWETGNFEMNTVIRTRENGNSARSMVKGYTHGNLTTVLFVEYGIAIVKPAMVLKLS